MREKEKGVGGATDKRREGKGGDFHNDLGLN